MQIMNLAVLAATLATVGAWTLDDYGKWVANNAWRDNLNGVHKVHESCAERDGSRNLGDGELCGYSTDANGGMFHGSCYYENDKIDCIQGCPDPFNTCQYEDSEGICVYGYAACLQKMGCSGTAQQADCMGYASGCASAC
ncbi:hypothetical protein ACET3X_009475 [Alternaria dauci]|uniref:Uncharacterized protein n=1 Tax=Alternaria dauci TaxID=48095 RepID=A0ABR3U8Z1_9PLEO